MDTLIVTSAAVEYDMWNGNVKSLNATPDAGKLFFVAGLGVTGRKQNKMCL